MKSKSLIQVALFALIAPTAFGAQAQAADKWRTECSSCHIAYPARALPAASWKKIMSGLDKHFGVDASLAPQDN